MEDTDALTQNLDDPGSLLVTGEPGDELFREGDDGDALYVLQNGEIELLKVTDEGDWRLGSRTRGDFLGELSVLAQVPREATARAVTQFAAYRIERAAFDQLVHDEPEIAVSMLRSLSRQIHALQAELMRRVQGSGAQGVLVHEGSETDFSLVTNEEMTVGRIDRRTGHIPHIDLTDYDPDRTLSRHHAKLLWQSGRLCLVEERATTNGTFVNEVRVTPGIPVALTSGDALRFGAVKLVFRRP